MADDFFERAKLRGSNGSLARFNGYSVDPANAVGLKPDHPALKEARTLFPTTVSSVADSPRLLVSGHNNPKLGKRIHKGLWKGFEVYHLSLEERASCPAPDPERGHQGCALWAACYGNAMHRARRHNHRDPDFLPTLRDELRTLQRRHSKGFVVRLHTLGDFYSPAYVQFWADALDDFDALHVFGYTHRREDDGDAESRETARALRRLTEQAWSIFAIRFSNVPGPQSALTVDEPIAAPDVIMCPAQEHKTAACATCGLCWSKHAREKAIGFLRHGMKSTRSKSDGIFVPTKSADRAERLKAMDAARKAKRDAKHALYLDWRKRYEGDPEKGIEPQALTAISAAVGVPTGSVRYGIITAGGVMRPRGKYDRAHA